MFLLENDNISRKYVKLLVLSFTSLSMLSILFSIRLGLFFLITFHWILQFRDIYHSFRLTEISRETDPLLYLIQEIFKKYDQVEVEKPHPTTNYKFESNVYEEVNDCLLSNEYIMRKVMYYLPNFYNKIRLSEHVSKRLRTFLRKSIISLTFEENDNFYDLLANYSLPYHTSLKKIIINYRSNLSYNAHIREVPSYIYSRFGEKYQLDSNTKFLFSELKKKNHGLMIKIINRTSNDTFIIGVKECIKSYCMGRFVYECDKYKYCEKEELNYTCSSCFRKGKIGIFEFKQI